jgi:TPR repeat protein
VGQSNLAFMYAQGRGVGQDFREAAKWFSKAAESGYAPAQGKLGQLYAAGNGVPLDYAAAYAWYKSAAVGGYGPAAIAMTALSKRMTPAQLQAAQALFLSHSSPRTRFDAVVIEKKLPTQQWPQHM